MNMPPCNLASIAMTNTQIDTQLKSINHQLRTLESRYGRSENSVKLIAVSKTRSAEEIRTAVQQQQFDFGENYVQEAVDKMAQLDDLRLTWHFIGPIQKNKTKVIAQHFDWVHSIERDVVASRLSTQRPGHMTPLNVCVQINIDQENSKSGIHPDDLLSLAQHINKLPNLHLRGLMAIPTPSQDFSQQRSAFGKLHALLDKLKGAGIHADTLSMGMSNDYEAAIAEGATMVRIGTAIFGPRKQ